MRWCGRVCAPLAWPSTATFGGHVVMWVHLCSSCVALFELRGLYSVVTQWCGHFCTPLMWPSVGYIWWSHSNVGVFVLLFHGSLQAQWAIFGSHVLMWARLHSSCVALCRLRGLYIFGGHMMMWVHLHSSCTALCKLRGLYLVVC